MESPLSSPSPSPSTSAPDRRGNTTNIQKSHYQQTVCLADWWLVKAENELQGRRLAVAGLTDRGKQAMRVFTSAPILKRYDDFTMETTDGICVILNGFINKTRTLENGFSSDVFNYFLFGFPPYWKEYDEKFVIEKPPSKDTLRDKHLKQLAQQLGSMGMEGAPQHVHSCEKDFESQGKNKAQGRRKSKRAKSLGDALPQRCSFTGLQKESYSGGTGDEDHTAPAKCLKNEVTSFATELQQKIEYKGIAEIKTRSKTQKARNKATESLQSHSFNRSRSGRLLMPTLEYWRNQRAIYGVDRTITGFEEGMLP